MIDDHQLAQSITAVEAVRVLCVGDVMLDRFVYGVVERVSPEAPVPVLRVTHEKAMLGGAGNVVRNLVALRAECCFVSLLGRDGAGRDVTRLLGQETTVESHVQTVTDRPTTIKTRFVAGTQQILRSDEETADEIAAGDETKIVERATADLGQAKALVLSDYGKGVLTPRVTQQLIVRARAAEVPIIVDPKGGDYSGYRGASVVTPNRRELAEASGMPVTTLAEVEAAARALADGCGLEHVLVTLSQDGMMLVPAGGAPIDTVSASARAVFDVSGAGDTVVATLAAGLAGGLAMSWAIRLANAAAGVVVAKTGTSVASPAEITAALNAARARGHSGKILSRADLPARLAEWREQGHEISFTNGCFDLLHPGHVSLLRQARAAADRLIVGLNSDASVGRLKGPTRPIQDSDTRATVLAALASVDAVVVFDEDTPAELIAAIAPDALVKGADYAVDEVVGADIVTAAGGRVVLATLEAGFSTTNTVAKINGDPASDSAV